MKKGLITILIILLIISCGVLGYFTYTLNENNTKYQDEINNYKSEIQSLKSKTTDKEQQTEKAANNDCSQIIKDSQ